MMVYELTCSAYFHALEHRTNLSRTKKERKDKEQSLEKEALLVFS